MTAPAKLAALIAARTLLDAIEADAIEDMDAVYDAMLIERRKDKYVDLHRILCAALRALAAQHAGAPEGEK